MKRKYKSILAGLLCLACLPVMPLNTAAEMTMNEYDKENGLHTVEIESDLFSYRNTSSYQKETGTPYYYGSGYLETDVVDVDFIVTGVAYNKGETEPLFYILNGLGKDIEWSATAYAPFLNSYLNGQEVHVGDLLSIKHFFVWETTLPQIGIEEDATVQNYGSGIDIFGEDFKKVLYYEMFTEPHVMSDSDLKPVSQSGYDYKIHDEIYDKIYDKGNINNDDKVDLIDVVTLNKHLMVGMPIGYYAQKCADVNNDGVVNPTDSLNILKHLLGLIGSFEELQG